eukprot:5734989-Lingulodinium_polyedra.AAC.1
MPTPSALASGPAWGRPVVCCATRGSDGRVSWSGRSRSGWRSSRPSASCRWHACASRCRGARG